MSEYVSKAITTSITAESKITLKIKDNFYSITFTESRDVPNVDDVDVEYERKLLFDDVNAVVENAPNKLELQNLLNRL